MPRILDKILRAGEGKIVRKLEVIARGVNALEEDISALSDDELKAQTVDFRARLADGESLDDLLPEAFATVREASKRVLGKRHFDVQIMGGAALHLGNIAEMKTGEGKTLVATLPSYLHGLTGDGVHVVTVNDYLAEYQGEQMGRIFTFLGLTTGVILTSMAPPERREAYACDVTYGTNNEFGFDYLRDNMAWSAQECVQRGHAFAVVDEVDSILIDEARTPLIISGPAEQSSKWYGEFAALVDKMRPERDYEVDLKKKTVGVLEPGITLVEDHLGIDNLYESANTPLVQFLNNAVKAKELFTRDKDYVVIDGEVLIVDEHTGRMLAGRRYSEGLHQALEAKERVEIKDENQTLATVTLQNYFRLYDTLSGMTGTALTEASEFNKIYNLGVVPIPTNAPMIRVDAADLVYRTHQAKFDAVVEDLADRYTAGQPVLVGTTSVEQSEELSTALRRKGVPHSVLNAKAHAREASIIAQAGRKGSVTVATNMAGRGTDIMLGGNPEALAEEHLTKLGLDPMDAPEAYEQAWAPAVETFEKQVADEHAEVVERGGLYVLGTERHESRRIDNQLRGRSGRQGDPGESRFYLSLEDDLMKRFKADWINAVLTTMKIPDDVPIENKRVTGGIANAQAQVESMNFESRKDVLKYDDVLDRQRKVIYAERRRVLEGADLSDELKAMVADTVGTYVTAATSEGFVEEWDLEKLWTELGQVYPVSITIDDVEESAGGGSGLSAEYLTEALRDDAAAAYRAREEQLGEPVMRQLEREVVLSVLDRHWREHLYEMDYLRSGIHLRSMAQRDPVVEYQREGYDLFAAMMERIKEESVGFVFHLDVRVGEEPPEGATVLEVESPDEQPENPDERVEVSAPGLGNGSRAGARLSYSAPTVDGDGGVTVSTEAGDDGTDFAGTARNAPCPCGSGKKYKRCHGDPRAVAKMTG